MLLTDTQIRNAKPKDKSYKLSDGGGLYLEVTPTGGKWWRFRYNHNGKENRISFGIYPDVPLAGRHYKELGIKIEGARDRREAARLLLAQGIDPYEHRKARKALEDGVVENSFEFITREWLVKFAPKLTPSSSARKQILFERDVFPWIGKTPVMKLTAADFLKVLRRIEDRGAQETASRARMYCSQSMRYAVATARAERDPTSDLRGALVPATKKHRAAITDPKAIGPLLRAIDNYQGHFVTKCALRLAPLFFVRPGELRKAEWCEIDLDKAEWTIPAARMKMRQPHLVPLSTQAISILTELKPFTGWSQYVFPSLRSGKRPMSDNAVLSALRRMGFAKEEMSGHGFRAMARTVLDEVLGMRPDYIEHQLAHAVRDPLGRAYNRTTHLPERRQMMQRWADYLDELKASSS